jgi:transcriptional regulator with XRE-family HTH domain
MNNSQTIAERIKQLTKERNITIKDLLKDLEIKDKDFISKIENGTNVGYINLVKIAEYLGCSLDYLIGRTNVVSITKDKRKSIILELDDKTLDEKLNLALERSKNKNEYLNEQFSKQHIRSRSRLRVKKKVKV